jgi:hypothetical protein
MLIECSFCHATAKLPDDKEGSKVRCSACGKVYVAHEKGTRVKGGRGGVNPATLGIGIGAVVVIAIFAFLANNHESPKPPPPPPVVVKEPAPTVDPNGWDGEYVRVVRGVYDMALAYNEGALVNLLDGGRIAKRLNEANAADPAKQIDFDALGAPEKQAFLEGIAQELMKGTDENAPHFWKPVDGRVRDFDLLDVVVRVTADKRLEQGSTEIADSRTFDWHLSRPNDRSKWKVWSWERFVTEEEKRLARKKTKSTMVALPTGERLYQAEMRHLDPYPDTPPEQIAQIEKAIATMLDFTLKPKENNVARDELVAIGRPAIPHLLNKFFEIKIVDTEDDPSLIHVNMVYETLRRITSYDPGFTAMPGQTEERRTMALKAYFAWWERKGKNFTGPPPPGKDLLEDLVTPTERDKREIEKAKAQSGGGK